MSTFCLPDLGEGLRDAEIVAWHVSEGDRIVADQPLVSVETQKAVVDIPSPESGRVVRLHGHAGDLILVGAPLVDFDSNELGSAIEPASDSVVGELPRQTKEAAPSRSDLPISVRAAPAVRLLAKQLGVDINALVGSGPQGSISISDLAGSSALVVQSPNSELSADTTRVMPDEGSRLRGTRRAMAQAMTIAGSQVVPATVTADADVTGWFGIDEPTIRLVSAVVAGCQAEPALNSWYDLRQQRLTVHREVHIGLATDAAQGLFVPVLRRAESLSTASVRATIDVLRAKVRDRSITHEDLAGPTITLSNFGTLVGRYAVLVVVPPQVAILGAGRIQPEVVPIDGAAAVRQILPLSLTFDHRVVTGGEAARFMRVVVDSLTSSAEILA